MAISLISLLILSFSFNSLTAQSQPNFSCSRDSPSSCQTYVIYRAKWPEYLNLGGISDLFGVSRLSIAKASNLLSEEAQLIEDQLLLIPIFCSCSGTRFISNVTYQIKEGDSFYLVSSTTFENLTNYHVVEEFNPTSNPNNLQIGDEVVFPLFCKCTNQSDSVRGIKYLITYVWQPGDDLLLLATEFNSSPIDIATENSYQNITAAVNLPGLIPVSELPILSHPHPKRNESKNVSIVVIVVSLSGAPITLLLASFLVYIYCIREKKKSLIRNGSSLETNSLIQMKKVSKVESFGAKIIQHKLLPGVSGYLGNPIMYEQKVITDATMNFNEYNRIGGSVYRAIIDGEVFAVRKTKDDVTEELKILHKVNHANLVKLMGMSSDSDGNCFLVYEFAENGPLDKWLYPKSSLSSSSVTFLTLNQRLNIALDVAKGLQYMHEHTQPSIVHRDIRTSNILLSSKFKGKIANFSMARPATSSVMPKVDVFSFGVVLLELLSGRKAMETKGNGDVVMLWKDINEILEDEEKKREDRLRRWMDPMLESFYSIDAALSSAALARACTLENSSSRPSMGEVVFNLSVLTQSYSDALGSSWNYGLETDEVQIIIPVMAR